MASFKNPRVASSGMVMVTSHDRVAQVCIGGYVDTALIGQDASVVMPIGES